MRTFMMDNPPPSYDGPAHSTDAPPCASTSPPAVEAGQRTGRARFSPWSAVAPLRAELREAGPPGLTGGAERSLAADNRFARSSGRSTCHGRTIETSPQEPADRLALTPFGRHGLSGFHTETHIIGTMLYGQNLFLASD